MANNIVESDKFDSIVFDVFEEPMQKLAEKGGAGHSRQKTECGSQAGLERWKLHAVP